MKEVLILDDDKIQLELLRSVLSDHYNLTCTQTLKEAEEAYECRHFDLCIVDLNLPDGSGLNFCTRVRSNETDGYTPIFVISSNTDMYCKISSLELGADDYITKPIYPAELKVKIRNLFRRLEKSHNLDIPKHLPFKIDFDRRRVFIKENENVTELDLTSKEFDLLLTFINNEGRIFSRQDLLDKIWSKDTNVVDRVIDTHISGLRKKIHPYSKTIKSEYGLGYKFEL